MTNKVTSPSQGAVDLLQVPPPGGLRIATGLDVNAPNRS